MIYTDTLAINFCEVRINKYKVERGTRREWDIRIKRGKIYRWKEKEKDGSVKRSPATYGH